MKITIINSADTNVYSKNTNSLKQQINILSNSNEVSYYETKNMDIHNCTGCWNCWMKNPGTCVFDDDMIPIYKDIVKSDLIIFAASIKAGFLHSDLKRVMDRMFALILPHMMLVKEELHHIPRYENQAKMGYVIFGEKNPTKELDEILKEYVYRVALNFNQDKGQFLHYYNADSGKEFLDEVYNV